ncbi:MAG: efflux RND transporter periplasmic adaptor subunit [Steroidobacteraceae bacterium]
MDSLDSATGPGAGRGARSGWSKPRQISALAGAVAVVVLIAFGYWLFEHGFQSRTPESNAPAPAAGTFHPTSQQLKTLTLEPVTLRAFVSEERTEGKIAVNADRATPVYSPYSGRVTRVIANLGDQVAQGAPLADIDASEFTQGLNDLRADAAQLKLARLAETRKHALYDIKGGSLADWQQAQADLSAAQTALNAARSRLQILGYSDAQIDQFASSEHFEPATAILAPIRGVVVDRQIGPGQYAQAGAANPVFTIADLSSVWLIANVREADAARVQRGQSVEVHVLAYPERTFSARVVYVAPTIDPGTHRLTVRAVMDNADGALKPEMFANFVILTSNSQQSPAVPDGAVVYEGDAAHVWLLRPDGTLVVTPIRTGRSNDGFVEVLDGLKAGDRVVTKGSLFIDRAAAG